MKYKVKQIRADMYRLYPSKIAYLYDMMGEFYPAQFYYVKAIGTVIPRQCVGLLDSIKTMHNLINMKHDLLPGAFENQQKANRTRKIWIRGMKHIRINEFSIKQVDCIKPCWRVFDLEDHVCIAYLDTMREALDFLHEYYADEYYASKFLREKWG